MTRTLAVYLNLNSSCNLRCSYCFEGDRTFTTKTRLDLRTLSFIDRLLQSPAFRNNFDALELRLSGGEPTLSSADIVSIVRRYRLDPVCFTIKTNGYKIPDVLKEELILMREEKLFDRPLIETHISYNGRESHDLTRPSVGGKTTSSEVRETLEWFVDNNVPFYILMSLTMETISMLFDSYKELNEFSTAPSLVERSCYPIFNYLEGQTLSQVDREALVLNLKKIAALILREKSWDRTPLNFDWFNANAITRCGAGASNFSIDTDGSIYPCYLCAYDGNEKTQHLLGDVTSDFETILKAGEKYVALAQKPLTGPCSSCNVSFCNRCPAARFKTSSKTGYDERWTDYSSSSAACEISRIVDLVARAFRRLDEQQDAVH